MPITTDDFNDLVKNANVKWREGYDSVERRARMLFDVTTTDDYTSEHSQIDNPTFARRKNQGQSYQMGNPRQGYTLNLTQSRIGLMSEVTWEMRRYDRYRQIESRMMGLGESTAKRIELDLTHLFTFGLQGSSYTNMDGETVNTVTGDAVQLFSDSHTITGGSDNVDNYGGTTAFSKTGLEAAERLFRNMINNQGEKVTPKPTHIITSDEPAICNLVKEFSGSDKEPDVTDNQMNAYKSKYQHLELPYLATDADGAPDTTAAYYWMLADLNHKDAVAEFSENPTFVAPSPGGNGEDFETDNWAFKSSASYAYGVLDPKWIVGQAATTVG